MSLNVERVRLLVDALRSGKYVQGMDRLEYVDQKTGKKRHCCLGVACRIAMLNGLNLQTQEGYVTKFGSGEMLLLPEEVVSWYGFDTSNPELILGSGKRATAIATTFNDVLRFDFNQIADAFERTYINPQENTE